MVDILALISSILFTPAFSISYFYETGVYTHPRKAISEGVPISARKGRKRLMIKCG